MVSDLLGSADGVRGKMQVLHPTVECSLEHKVTTGYQPFVRSPGFCLSTYRTEVRILLALCDEEFYIQGKDWKVYFFIFVEVGDSISFILPLNVVRTLVISIT